MDGKAPVTSRTEVVEFAGASGTSGAQDAIASLIGQLFAGERALDRERRALQAEDEPDTVARVESDDAHFEAGAFETALANLQSDIVDRIRCGVLADIRQRLLPAMEDAINLGVDSLLRSDLNRPVEPGAAGRWPTNERGREAAVCPEEPNSSSELPPLFAEQTQDDSRGSGDAAVVQPSRASEHNGVYEGTVTLRVRAGLDVLNAMVQFVAELRGRPDLCLFKLMATTDRQETDIYVGLREPLQMKEVLLQMAGVCQVDASTTWFLEGDEPLIHVQLESSGAKVRRESASVPASVRVPVKE